MNHTQIEALLDILGDAKHYEGGDRRPDTPGFIFFDDEPGTPEDREFAAMAADWEHFKASQEHVHAIQSGKERHARIAQIRRVIPIRTEFHAKQDSPRSGYFPKPNERDKKRAAYLTRKVDLRECSFKEVEDDYEDQEIEKAAYKMVRILNMHALIENNYRKNHPEYDEDGTLLNPPLDIEPQTEEIGEITYSELQEEQRYANWLVGWAKRQAKTPNNDHWRKLIMPLVGKMDDKEIETIVRTVAKSLPFAPGPVAATTFVNPDGSKHTTAGTSIGTAKAAYIQRHKLATEFVTIDRVQYDGQRTSKWVVGTRRRSDETMSNWYDPNPNGRRIVEPDGSIHYEGYDPNAAATLIRWRFGKTTMPVPDEARVLTVRETEMAIIAGAETCENAIEAYADSLSGDDLPEDTRMLSMELGDGKEARHQSAFDHIETYVYQMLRGAGMDRIAQLIELRVPGLLYDQVTINGRYTEEFIELLAMVRADDLRNRQEDPDYDLMLPEVIKAFSPPEDHEEHIPTKLDALKRPKELGYAGEPTCFDQDNARANYMERVCGRRWAHFGWSES